MTAALRLVVVALFLLASCKGSGPGADPAPCSAAPPAAGPADPILGAPLVLLGRSVPWEELRVAVCEGHAGAAAIRRAKMRIFVEDELQRCKQAGVEIPALPPEPKAALAALFLPADPDAFPPTTMEVILAQEDGEELLAHYRDAFEEDARREPNMAERQVDEALLVRVLERLELEARTESHPAPGVLCRVDGRDILARDVWDELAPTLAEADVREAKQWLAKTTLLRDAFERAGAWLSDAEAEDAYHAHSDPYKDAIYSYERIALYIQRFPSLERYREYRRHYESFLRWKAPEMTADVLSRQATFRTNALVGQVTVDADVLLCSAFDFEHGRWKPDGWADAERRMRAVVERLEAGASWDELMESCSDYPLEGAVDPRVEQGPDGGRFRKLQRNNLMMQLGESEYSLFLEGHSISDAIAFQQEVGTTGAPVRGPFGWYLPRLMRRSEPLAGQAVDADSLRELCVQDYANWHLNALAEELARGIAP